MGNSIEKYSLFAFFSKSTSWNAVESTVYKRYMSQLKTNQYYRSLKGRICRGIPELDIIWGCNQDIILDEQHMFVSLRTAKDDIFDIF